MAQVPYIARQLLKDRAQLGNLPIPLDADLDRLISTASTMVKDRTVPFEETAPPDAVQQVTLMLALNLRTSETGNYTDADGHPVQVPVWTQGMTQILGKLMRDETPDPAQAAAGTLRTSRPYDTVSEYRRPRYVEVDEEPLGACLPWGWDR